MNLTTGIDMTTGSLGQGFSCAVGIAVGAKMAKKDFTVYTIVGDGESQEGQVWEAAMLAGTRKLDNLIAFTDFNNLQIDGYTADVNDINPLDKKWEAFNFHVQVVDGHDIAALKDAITSAQNEKGKPSMIILNTLKGKGAYFAEHIVCNHNMPVTEEMWKKAVAELDGEVQ